MIFSVASTPSCGFLLWVSESWRTLRNYSTTCCFSFSTVLHPISYMMLTRFCLLFPTGIVGLNFEAFWHHADFQDASSDSEFHAAPEVSRQHPRVVLTKGSDIRIWHGIGEIAGTSINQQVPVILEVLFGGLAWKRPWTIGQSSMADVFLICSYQWQAGYLYLYLLPWSHIFFLKDALVNHQ